MESNQFVEDEFEEAAPFEMTAVDTGRGHAAAYGGRDAWSAEMEQDR